MLHKMLQVNLGITTLQDYKNVGKILWVTRHSSPYKNIYAQACFTWNHTSHGMFWKPVKRGTVTERGRGLVMSQLSQLLPKIQ